MCARYAGTVRRVIIMEPIVVMVVKDSSEEQSEIGIVMFVASKIDAQLIRINVIPADPVDTANASLLECAKMVI